MKRRKQKREESRKTRADRALCVFLLCTVFFSSAQEKDTESSTAKRKERLRKFFENKKKELFISFSGGKRESLSSISFSLHSLSCISFHWGKRDIQRICEDTYVHLSLHQNSHRDLSQSLKKSRNFLERGMEFCTLSTCGEFSFYLCCLPQLWVEENLFLLWLP